MRINGHTFGIKSDHAFDPVRHKTSMRKKIHIGWTLHSTALLEKLKPAALKYVTYYTNPDVHRSRPHAPCCFICKMKCTSECSAYGLLFNASLNYFYLKYFAYLLFNGIWSPFRAYLVFGHCGLNEWMNNFIYNAPKCAKLIYTLTLPLDRA